ncbi:MAG: nucleoside triphosphate diphosphatase [Gammaproteobacteria bacterium]|jgi:MazG family protein|nr:nucleoside triphosphate diphosphatase [Gammaproteobacteria bacterium]
MTSRLLDLLAIMERLRGADGCPWDRVQTFASIAPYTIEESYEVADAIEHGDMANLKDELGDLLFQVVFHARIAEEAGHFDFDAVAGAICDKLVRRHPHVFGGTEVPANGLEPAVTAAVQSAAWEEIKARERAAATAAAPSALDGVPLALPALMRAFKLSRRAARVGFDFERPDETADKVAEELAEVREAAAAANGADESDTAAHRRVFEEVGDLLFAAANLARKLDVDAEAALRAANVKFERRFHGMERLAVQRGEDFSTLSLAAQEALWQEVKRAD